MDSDPLKEVRQKIDHINLSLVDLLDQRFQLLEEVLKIKEQHSLPLKDEAREEEIMKLIQSHNLVQYHEPIKVIIKTILRESLKVMAKDQV